MKKTFYPAVFHKAEEGGYWVSFPDFPECLTEGDDMAEAYEMAVDALGLELTDRIKRKEEVQMCIRDRIWRVCRNGRRSTEKGELYGLHGLLEISQDAGR